MPRDDHQGSADARAAESQRIPRIEETLRVEKRVEEVIVRVRKDVYEHTEQVSIPLHTERYEIERVPINQVVEQAPEPVRYEGDTMIIPILEEEVVITTRLRLKEELRITKVVNESLANEEVKLKKEEVTVERNDLK